MTIIGVKHEKSVQDDRKSEELTKEQKGLTKQEMERKRAMVLGQFSFLDEAERNVFDNSPSLHDAVKTWKLANRDERKRVRIQYEPLPETVDGVEKSTKASRRTKGYETMVLPKVGETFVVVWVTSKGDVVVDKDVMLLNMKEVITTKDDQPEISGPKGPKFAFIERCDERESDPRFTFDLDLFWSVGFLFKHFKSCGLQKWDKQMVTLRRETQAKTTKEGGTGGGGRRRTGSGKYQGKLTGWKGTYGFIQCTSGAYNGKTIFLHHTDIISPYLHLVRGLQFRFDVTKEGDESDKLRAVKAQPCLCKFSCTVHESDDMVKKSSPQQGRRRRRSSKSSGSAKLNSSGEAGPNSGSEAEGPEVAARAAVGEGEKRNRGGKKRRQFSRRQRKSDAEVEA